MPVVTLPVTHRKGLHLRAAAMLVRVASRHQCRILVRTPRGEADGRSLISLLILAVQQGSDVTLVVEGEGAEAALLEIQRLFADDFGLRDAPEGDPLHGRN